MSLTEVVAFAQDSAYGLLIAFVALAIWAFYAGKIHTDREFSKLEDENRELKAALLAERTSNAELAQAGSVTNQLIGALRDVATERRAGDHKAIRGRDAQSGLTAEDFGL